MNLKIIIHLVPKPNVCDVRQRESAENEVFSPHPSKIALLHVATDLPSKCRASHSVVTQRERRNLHFNRKF